MDIYRAPRPPSPQSEEEQRLRTRLTEFIVELARALAHAGPYDPAGPEAGQARAASTPSSAA